MTMTLFQGPLTGGKTLGIFVAFFGVIISVNLVLAYQAVSTFPGVETANSYVASQTFDDDRAAQEALGWTANAQVSDGALVLSLTDAAGRPVEPASVLGIFGRPTTTRDDQSPDFTFDGTVWRAPVNAGMGQWNLRLRAIAQDGTPFRQRIVVVVN
jgi:nitrogen fixation protein FixH